jgi:hypothetical protein
LEEKDNKKEIKETYHWDDDTSAEGETEVKVKRSKKVEKRQIKELEKNRKKGVLKDFQRSRITKKGKIGLIASRNYCCYCMVCPFFRGVIRNFWPGIRYDKNTCQV